MTSEEELIQKILKKNILNDIEVNIKKIAGDASSRRYYRAVSSKETVICSIDKPKSQQNSDYIGLGKSIVDSIRIPKILFYDENISIVVQEDLGDIDLNMKLAISSLEERKDLLRRTLKIIGSFQEIDIKKAYCKEVFFDSEKIYFELNMTKKYFEERYINLRSSTFDSFAKKITKYFDENLKVVCHRDFHGRNIHYKNNELITIDFQDSRIGPRTYDLVSILEDSYFIKSEEEIEEMKAVFYEMNLKYYSDRNAFDREYGYVAIERLYKVLGSFCYLKEEKGLDRYEKYIGLAFERLRKYLEFFPEFDSFRKELVERYYAN